ncbi:DUF4354 family protein [Candidatus Hamiltonella defensa]|uniref:DUF4354 domain-containing protein n=1 Tax=Candidatus Williamhamiltonella defendens TaxID=138072 RepID=A0AAC9YF26_9ENTR|nr:DUF4354 family protein [Candidatus Hamiltonella defensa]ASV33221.1 hypothetical protein CJJ18_03030 [Candidatus Hamiltonella defensa]AWK16181.1 hypothetical protein CCS40_03055 [Candidatus Hamiltonella defensa]MBK4361414.1 DUF4354 family protein [Candidatus Hamiltonella defensa]
MRKKIFIASILLAGCCLTAAAKTVDKIIVFSTEKSKGAFSIGRQQTYTKTFDIALSNNSQQDIELSTSCLKAFDSNGKEFKLDTVDEKLIPNKLKKGELVKGIAMFVSDDASVYGANIVRLVKECDKKV